MDFTAFEGTEDEEHHTVNDISSLVHDDVSNDVLNDTAIAELLFNDVNPPAINNIGPQVGDNNAIWIGPRIEDNNPIPIGIGYNNPFEYQPLIGNRAHLILGNDILAIGTKYSTGNTALGHGCCVNMPGNISGVTAIGAESEVTKSYGIAVGTNLKVDHDNCVLIGNNLTSRSDDSVLIGGMVEFKDDSLSLADDNLIIFGNNTQETNKCQACNLPLTSGIKWTHDSEANITHTLCLQCIYDCVLEFKAKESWALDTGTSEIKQLRNDLTDLRKQVSALEDCLKHSQ
jgi:hypothetical protein